MTPEEKIDALREKLSKPWCTCGVCNSARQQALDIIDPPKPKWRKLVDEAANDVGGLPLSQTLIHLSNLADLDRGTPLEGPEWHLARIVAICEGQVGGGWQADPDMGGHRVTLMSLLRRLAVYEETGRELLVDWQGLGHEASAWLRSLTDGGAA